VWTHLKYYGQLGVPQYEKNIGLFECVQRRVTKTAKGLRCKTSDLWMRSLGLFSLEERRLRGCPHGSLQIGSSRGGGADLLSLVTSDRTLGNGMKLHQGKFMVDVRKRLFTERLVSCWHRLHREVVRAPSLSEFKEQLDNALSRMV